MSTPPFSRVVQRAEPVGIALGSELGGHMWVYTRARQFSVRHMCATVRTERVEHTGGQGLRVRDEVKHVWLLRAVFDVVRSRVRGAEGFLGLMFPGHVQPNNAWLALSRQLSHHMMWGTASQV